MNSKDLYEFLNVSRTASQAEIDHAYQTLSLQCHPVKNKGDTDAQNRFTQINKAYKVLGDPEERARYDNKYFTMQIGSSFDTTPLDISFRRANQVFNNFFDTRNLFKDYDQEFERMSREMGVGSLWETPSLTSGSHFTPASLQQHQQEPTSTHSSDISKPHHNKENRKEYLYTSSYSNIGGKVKNDEEKTTILNKGGKVVTRKEFTHLNEDGTKSKRIEEIIDDGTGNLRNHIQSLVKDPEGKVLSINNE